MKRISLMILSMLLLMSGCSSNETIKETECVADFGTSYQTILYTHTSKEVLKQVNTSKLNLDLASQDVPSTLEDMLTTLKQYYGKVNGITFEASDDAGIRTVIVRVDYAIADVRAVMNSGIMISPEAEKSLKVVPKEVFKQLEIMSYKCNEMKQKS